MQVAETGPYVRRQLGTLDARMPGRSVCTALNPPPPIPHALPQPQLGAH